jgi:hypothetical protein
MELAHARAAHPLVFADMDARSRGGVRLGARILPWLADLHFGERWRLGVKLLWAAFVGLAGVGGYRRSYVLESMSGEEWRRMVRAKPSL